MISMMTLALQILLILRDAGERLVPQSTLVASLRLVDRKESLSEINAALRDLESREEVLGAHNPDLGNKWKLADAGKVRLAAANL
jgi:hypothetical protein